MKSIGNFKDEKTGRNYELWQDEEYSNSFQLEVTTENDYCFCAGLTTDNRNRIVDFDGVYQLSKNTVYAIRKLGLIVPRDMVQNRTNKQKSNKLNLYTMKTTQKTLNNRANLLFFALISIFATLVVMTVMNANVVNLM